MAQFLAPYSLDECAKRLKRLSLGDTSVFSSTRVNITQADKESLDYEIRKWKYLNFVAEMSGTLVYEDNSSTSVVGQAKVSARWYMLIILHVISGLVILLSFVSNGQYQFVPILIVAASIVPLLWLRLLKWRNELEKSVKDVLR